MTRRLCIVPEMVVLVILVGLLILASILSGILFGCAGWCGFFFFYASDLDCVWGLCFHLEAPVLTCFLLYLFCCYYISKLVRLSNCPASSWPLWLVLWLLVLAPQRFAKTVFLVASELWICIFSLYHLKIRATLKDTQEQAKVWGHCPLLVLCSALGVLATVVWLLVSCAFLHLVLHVYLGKELALAIVKLISIKIVSLFM